MEACVSDDILYAVEDGIGTITLNNRGRAY